MEKSVNKSFPRPFRYLPMKLTLCYYLTILKKSEIENQNIKLLSNYSNIETILEIKNAKIYKFLYFNRINNQQILYNSERTIYINFDEYNKDLSNYFYLSLLLYENSLIVNYTYSLEYIKKLDNIREEDDNIIKKLIISKIIIELIKNYRIFDTYNDEEKDELDIIERNNYSIIENNIEIIKELDTNLNKNNFISNKIDDIYIDIIISLIKKRKLENYKYIYSKFELLDLKSIDITRKMFDKLSKILNENEDYIKDYNILELEDLFDNKKINFIFILIKYIFKNSINIYNIPFFIKIRKNIMKLLNRYINDISSFYSDNKIIKERFEYILIKITGSFYYYEKYSSILKEIEKNKNKEEIIFIDQYNEELIINDKNLEKKDIEFLSKKDLNQLKYISMNNNNLNDIYPLKNANLEYLEKFCITHNKISDISVLQIINFDKLKQLNLEKNEIVDISPLKNINCINLEALYLNDNKISNIDIFENNNFNKLKELYLYNNDIEDIYSLKNAKISNLELLNLNNNKIYDIDVLKDVNFKQLKYLYLYNNNLSEINALENVNFELLEILNLNKNKISNISNLENSHFKELKELHLSYNLIIDIKCLQNFKFEKLKILSLEKNKINEIDILEKVKFLELKELNLSFNNISNINALGKANFEKLEILKLNNNKIFDIDIFEKVNFKKLKELWLNNNEINNIDVFNQVKFNELEKLKLNNNKIIDISVFEKIILYKLKDLYSFNKSVDDMYYLNYNDKKLLFLLYGYPKIFNLKQLYLNKNEIKEVKNRLIIRYLNTNIKIFFI